MSIELLKALKEQTVKDYIKIHFQMTNQNDPEQFIIDFCEYTSYLETKSRSEYSTLSKFSFKQFLLSKIIEAPLD